MHDFPAKLCDDSKISFTLKTTANASVLGIKTSTRKPDFEYWDWQLNKFCTYTTASLPKEFPVGEILVLRKIAEGVKGPSDMDPLRNMREKSLRAAGQFPSQLSSVTGSESPGSESEDRSIQTFDHSSPPPLSSPTKHLQRFRATSRDAAIGSSSGPRTTRISGSESPESGSEDGSNRSFDHSSSPSLSSPTKHLRRFTATSRDAASGSSNGREGAHISGGKKRKAGSQRNSRNSGYGPEVIVISSSDEEEEVEKKGKRRKIFGGAVIDLTTL